MAGILESMDCTVITFYRAEMKACNSSTKLLLYFLLSMC